MYNSSQSKINEFMNYNNGTSWKPKIHTIAQHLILIKNFQKYESYNRGSTWQKVKANTFKHLILNKGSKKFVSNDRGASWELLTTYSDFDISIYPNPSTEFCFVEINGKINNNIIKVLLTDTRGCIVLSQESVNNRIKLDTHSLTSGLYLVSIYSESFKCIKSIIVY
jgi:hypothetical protein